MVFHWVEIFFTQHLQLISYKGLDWFSGTNILTDEENLKLRNNFNLSKNTNPALRHLIFQIK